MIIDGEIVFAPNLTEVLILLGLVGVGVTAITYLILRLFVWSEPASKSLEYIRKHALWTGILAWALSSLAGAAHAGLYDPTRIAVPGEQWTLLPWFAIIAPAVAVVGVNAIGQATWPAPKSAKRVAVLEFRRARDYVQRGLGWTVLGVFALSAGVLAFLFFVPGFISSQGVVVSPSGESIVSYQGRLPGYVLATALTVALLILSAGTLLVMRLIASRRSLEALTTDQNTTLRVIGMNRALRVSATVASGLAGIAGNYLAQPAPDSGTTSWTNWLGIVNAMVLIAMLLWKPPFLDTEMDDAGYNSLFINGTSQDPAWRNGAGAARLTGTAGIVAPASAVAGLLLGLSLTQWFGWLGPLALALVFTLLTHLGLELLLRRNYAPPRKVVPSTVAPNTVAPNTVRTSLKAGVPVTLTLAISISAVALIPALITVAGITRGGANDWPGLSGSAPHFLVPLVVALAVVVTGACAATVVWLRPALTDVAPVLERTLRRRALFRILRTVAGGLWAVLGAVTLNIGTAPSLSETAQDSGLGIVGVAFLVLAAVLCFYPVRSFTPAEYLPGTAARVSK